MCVGFFLRFVSSLWHFLQEEEKIQERKSHLEDRLARQRHDDQLAQTKRSQEDLLRMQEESVAKQEAMRKS